MDSRISTKSGERMKKALVILIMDTGLVKLDRLNNFVVISKSRPAQKRMINIMYFHQNNEGIKLN